RTFTRAKPNTPARRPDRASAEGENGETASAAAKSAAPAERERSSRASGASTKAAAAHDPSKPQQEEFGFGGNVEPAANRGSFDKSDRNLFEGQDLDVPTYLRRGIKVTA
ncbi:MAG TPA: hypothetical protein VK477_13350, partial [Acidobacteriota bacterium]|nr:hypothetical protein [Acidobacteriota bacterium]